MFKLGTLILVGAHQDALLEELILHDARARIQELKAPEVVLPFALANLDCEGPDFHERWRVLRDLTRLELPTSTLQGLMSLQGWTGGQAQTDASIPGFSLPLRALAIMMHDRCLPAAFQHVLDWDCLYFELGNRSQAGCQQSAYENYNWWIDPEFVHAPGRERFCHFGCATALVLTAMASMLEEGVSDQNARSVMDQLQLAEALLGRGGDLDYASSSKWGSDLTSLASVMIDYLASLGHSSREVGPTALQIAREVQPCDPILQQGCWSVPALPSRGSWPDEKGRHQLAITIFGDHSPAMKDCAGLLHAALLTLGYRAPDVAWAGGYYLCETLPGGCLMDASQDFLRSWSSRELRGPDEEAEALRAALRQHPHPRASKPDLLLCTNLAVFCWLLRRRGAVEAHVPAMHVFGMAFLADVPLPWRAQMLDDFYQWWRVSEDVFAACQELLSVQMWWQMGVKIPFVPLAGTTHAAYDPPVERKLLILRSAYWHMPSGRVFATMLERFASGVLLPIWLGRYTHTVALREVGPKDSTWVSFDDMGQHTCALDVPAELSQMKVLDVMSMGLPLISPERAWLLRLLHDMYRGWGQLHVEHSSQRSSRCEGNWPHAPFYDPKVDPLQRLSYWLGLADHFRFPHILHFASLPDMITLVIDTSWADVSVRLRAHHRRVVINSEQFYVKSLTRLIGRKK